MSNGPLPAVSTPTTLYCPTCGVPTPGDAQVCPQCGSTLPSMGLPIAPIPPAPPARAAVQSQNIYAGFWLRFVAAFLDGLLLQVVIMPIAFMVGLVVGVAGGAVSMPEPGTELVAGIGGMALGLVAGWLYSALMESSQKQATLGKMLLGIRVTDEQGQRISFARATGRHFAKLVSAITLFIGYIMAGFTAKKQALHDMMAGTLVVRK